MESFRVLPFRRADEVIDSMNAEVLLELSKPEGFSEDLIGGMCIKVNCQTGKTLWLCFAAAAFLSVLLRNRSSLEEQ